MKLRILKLTFCSLFVLGVFACWHFEERRSVASAQNSPAGPTSSGPIAVTPDDKTVWVANPDSDSVSVINVENDANQLAAEIKVGDEPNNLAVSPNGQTVYVANTISGTVSIINAATRQKIGRAHV